MAVDKSSASVDREQLNRAAIKHGNDVLGCVSRVLTVVLGRRAEERRLSEDLCILGQLLGRWRWAMV